MFFTSSDNQPEAEAEAEAEPGGVVQMTAGEAYAKGLLAYKPSAPDEPVQPEWLDAAGRKLLGYEDYPPA